MDSNQPQKPTPPKGSQNKKNDKKGSPLANNIIVVVLIGFVVLLLFLGLGPHQQQVSVPYSDLLTLIEKGPGGTHEIRGSNGVIFRYSGLFKNAEDTPLQVGSEAITGKIDRIQVEPARPNNHKAEGLAFQTPRMGLEEDQFLFDTLRKSELNWGGEASPSPLMDYGIAIIFCLLVLILIYYLFRKLSGAGSPMAFGRSRGRMYAQEDIEVTFDEVAGIDEAVDELREVVEFLRYPEKYQNLGGRIPKGVLLVGPPGTGKTLLAKAIAGEAGVPFFSLSGSDFVEMFVGVGAARVRDLFNQAESKSPCIIFIDELDALGKTRGGSVVGAHDEREQTLNALLVEMDGFDANTGVIVMAATNRPETLDPALLRPGRFDRNVLVDRPDIRGREAILKVHVENVKLDDSVDLKSIARITSGFVGADLANLVNEAALLAARNGKPAVSMEEFNEGVERVTAGLEKKQRIIHQDEKQRVAYHESGHALVAHSLPNTDPVHKVSVIPRGLAALGYMLQRPEGDRYLMTKGELESRIKVLLAGTIAEEIIFEEVSTGAQNDLERATSIARSMVMDYGMSRLGRVTFRESSQSPFLAGSGGADAGRMREHSEQTAREIDEEVQHIVTENLEAVRKILGDQREILERMAQTLIIKEVIDAEELQRIIDGKQEVPTAEELNLADEEKSTSEEGDADEVSPKTLENGQSTVGAGNDAETSSSPPEEDAKTT
ncbi:ATP-dependent zinc metalloprotease FtsH [Planctomycetales bacterium 10988]|nr:ATP-dependent zinc metalloprotease FtsH [Planctomycetales bacterium 10988]